MTNETSKSQEVLSALEETLTRILRIGYYEMSDQKPVGQVHEFAELLPQMCEVYSFATKEELSRAIYLMPDLLIVDNESEDSSNA